jgi:hypothetical protein
LGAQQATPILVQPDFALGPQANATPAQDPAQQDVVTLASRAGESEHTRSGNNKVLLEVFASNPKSNMCHIKLGILL